MASNTQRFYADQYGYQSTKKSSLITRTSFPFVRPILMEELRKRGCAVSSVMAGTRGARKGVGRCLPINATNCKSASVLTPVTKCNREDSEPERGRRHFQRWFPKALVDLQRRHKGTYDRMGRKS
ncbi:hypothetical protein GHT06_012895 [Daphnia sinensis]|uniref:Uncharacterized protein n=1 Tax=Daphnia sinensis TaxID=1820382 RepID=A0AAD5PWK3_9CRUS|nr:hypothetical protein GHT06_012895 [Daphnia sinensis]